MERKASRRPSFFALRRRVAMPSRGDGYGMSLNTSFENALSALAAS